MMALEYTIMLLTVCLHQSYYSDDSLKRAGSNLRTAFSTHLAKSIQILHTTLNSIIEGIRAAETARNAK